jgi:ketosteroid isomerase-like protein
MPFTGPIEDRLALRELYSRYADAAFTGNGQAWLDCWAEDCVWMTPMGELRGKQALLAQWEMLWAGIEQMTFFTEVGSIEAEGDSARSHAYCRESSLWKDGRRITVTGRYDDEVMRDSGVWRFMRRTFTLLLQES